MSKPRSAAAHAKMLRKRFKLISVEMRVSHKKLVDRQEQNLIELTSGGVSTADLRRAGHPYAVRTRGKRKKGGKFKKAAPSLPINKQEGVLQRSRRKPLRYKGPKGQVYDLYFEPGQAGNRLYVVAPGGTKRMRSRGFWREMQKRYRKDLLINRRAFRAKAEAIKKRT
jgi:hypothetical protein